MNSNGPVFGVLAHSVRPNAKCEGCLHFNSLSGPTGQCSVGLIPISCGDGANEPQLGYNPIVNNSNKGEYGMPATAPPARPGPPAIPDQSEPHPEDGDIVGDGGIVEILGEEYLALAKSCLEEHESFTKSACPMHQGNTPLQSVTTHSVAGVPCRCVSVSVEQVIKSFVRRLSNVQRASLDPRAIAKTCLSVVKG